MLHHAFLRGLRRPEPEPFIPRLLMCMVRKLSVQTIWTHENLFAAALIIHKRHKPYNYEAIIMKCLFLKTCAQTAAIAGGRIWPSNVAAGLLPMPRIFTKDREPYLFYKILSMKYRLYDPRKWVCRLMASVPVLRVLLRGCRTFARPFMMFVRRE